MSDVKNVVIIGSGPAGLTAAIYAARANLKPVVYEGFMAGGQPGGQLMETGEVENFPGWPTGISGQELMANIRSQAVNSGSTLIMEDINAIDTSERPFKITTMNEETVLAKTVIIATGARARRLPLDSEKKFWMKGISACAVCDGALPLFRDKPLAVIGGGDSAIEEAMHLTKFGSKVYLIHRRDELRASKVMQKRALECEDIEILWNKTVEEFTGGDLLEGVTLKDTVTGELSSIEINGCFQAIGHIPNTAFLNDQLDTDDAGYLLTTPGTTKTSVTGIFAAGDVQDSKYRQAITSAGSGCMAALEAEHLLVEEDA